MHLSQRETSLRGSPFPSLEEKGVRAHSKAKQAQVFAPREDKRACTHWAGAGTRRGVITNWKAWLNAGILTWGSCVTRENESHSDCLTRAVRDFCAIGNPSKSATATKMPHSKSGSWQKITTLSVTQNWKQQNSLQFRLLVYKCCNIFHSSILQLN